MKKTFAVTCAALAAVALANQDAGAQLRSPVSFEVRASAAIPTGDFADVAGGIGTGYGIGATGEFALTPMLGIYAGYSYTGYDLDNVDDTLNETGIDAGIRANLGSGLGAFTPYLKGGIVYHQLETDLFERDEKLGFEVGGGLDYPLGPTLSVTPGISYTRISGDVPQVDVSAVRLGIGLRARL